MSYQKQKFMNHLHNNNYANPGVYCNALDNVEKHFFADIDAEFEKDECESLYNKIQQTRNRPPLKSGVLRACRLWRGALAFRPLS